MIQLSSLSAFLPSPPAGRRVEVAAGRLYMYNKGHTSHCGLAIYIKKYLKAKEELQKLRYFNVQKYNPLKETNILQDIITLELISSFNTSQKIIFQKSSYKNRPIIIIT
jgi:hypothetical protein